MLFKVGNEIIDTETTPVALIFKTKEEGKVVGEIIANIKNGDSQYSVENNGNWWMMFPAGVSKEEIDKWSILTPEQKELLEKAPCVSTIITNEL
jgi:hypothetical protein